MNPQTLTQGQQYMGGTVKYDTATGKLLSAGQTTLSIPTIDGSKLGTGSGGYVAPKTDNKATNDLAIKNATTNIGLTNDTTKDTTTNITPTTDRNTILQSLMDLITKQGTKGTETIQAQEDAGVFAQKQKLTELQNQYTAKEQAYAKQEEELRKNEAGAYGGGLQIKLDDLSRKKNSELADIAINVNMTKGLYDTALDIAKTKIDAEFEPIQAQIDGLKTAYDFLQNDLTDSEKMQAQALIDEKQSAADFEREKKLLAYKAMIDNASGVTETTGTIETVTSPSELTNVTSNLASIFSGMKGTVAELGQAALGVITASQNLASNNPTGAFAGASPVFRKPGIFQSKEGIANRQYIEAVNLAVQRWASGAALTEAQTKQVRKLTPDKNDTDRQIQNKLNGLTQFMLSQIQSTLISKGINYQPPSSINLFSSKSSSSDPLGLGI